MCCEPITMEWLCDLGFTPDSGGFMLNGVFIWRECEEWRVQISGLNRVIETRDDVCVLVALADTELA